MEHAAPTVESDFSPRKMRIAFAILLGTLFGSSILPMMAIGFLLLPMTEEFGWSRAAYSGGMTAMMLAGAASAPFLGAYVDRIGVRLMIIGGTVLVGLVVMAMSLQDGSLWQFYGSFAVLGITGTTAIGYSKVIGALFNVHRGKALAVFGVESSLAGAAAPFIILYLLENFGWRGTFVGLGLIILAVVPVLLLWLEEPDAPGVATSQGHVPPERLPGLSAREVLHTRTFWLIAIASMLAIGPAFGMLPHWLPYMIGRGYTADSAGWVISAMTLAMAIGTVVGGLALDWAKGAWIAAPFNLIMTVALAMFMLISSEVGGVPALIVAMSLLGFAGGALRPMGTYFQLRFFGLKAFGTIVGIQAPFLALGMGVAPPLVGWSFDELGTYQPAMLVMTGCMAVTVLLYLMLGPYRFARNLGEAPAGPQPAGDRPEQVTPAVSTA